jgi:hypothetical protein
MDIPLSAVRSDFNLKLLWGSSSLKLFSETHTGSSPLKSIAPRTLVADLFYFLYVLAVYTYVRDPGAATDSPGK